MPWIVFVASCMSFRARCDAAARFSAANATVLACFILSVLIVFLASVPTCPPLSCNCHVFGRALLQTQLEGQPTLDGVSHLIRQCASCIPLVLLKVPIHGLVQAL